MDETHLSFGAQAMRYFQRDHEDIRRTPVVGPAAWSGRELSVSDEWVYRLSAADVAEIDDALDAVRQRRLTLATLRREDFRLPRLPTSIARWRHDLLHGRGF